MKSTIRLEDLKKAAYISEFGGWVFDDVPIKWRFENISDCDGCECVCCENCNPAYSIEIVVEKYREMKVWEEGGYNPEIIVINDDKYHDAIKEIREYVEKEIVNV